MVPVVIACDADASRPSCMLWPDMTDADAPLCCLIARRTPTRRSPFSPLQKGIDILWMILWGWQTWFLGWFHPCQLWVLGQTITKIHHTYHMSKGKLDIKANNPKHPMLMDRTAREMLIPSVSTNRCIVLTLIMAYTSRMPVQVL